MVVSSSLNCQKSIGEAVAKFFTSLGLSFLVQTCGSWLRFSPVGRIPQVKSWGQAGIWGSCNTGFSISASTRAAPYFMCLMYWDYVRMHVGEVNLLVKKKLGGLDHF